MSSGLAEPALDALVVECVTGGLHQLGFPLRREDALAEHMVIKFDGPVELFFFDI